RPTCGGGCAPGSKPAWTAAGTPSPASCCWDCAGRWGPIRTRARCWSPCSLPCGWWHGSAGGGGAARGRGGNARRRNPDLKSSRVSLREASMLGQMVKLLRSPYERLALYGLEMLEQHAPERIDRYLVELLDHPTASVRAKAIEIAASRRLEALRTRLDRL